MQLDKTIIAIRERDILDILDVTMHVIAKFLRPLLVTFLVGVAPIWLLQHYMIGGFDLAALDEGVWFDEGQWRISTVVTIIACVVFLGPLAAVPTTLYLGQALFLERPSAARIFTDALRALPQLFCLQVILRGILMFPTLAIVPYAVWPYLNEIVLLERNPLFGRRKTITTMKRSSSLHGSSLGELLGRWMTSIIFAAVMAGFLFLAMWWTRCWLVGNLDLPRRTFVLCAEVSIWATFCYFTVVRFLCYLDLRIRREGWEVELKMRAEGIRLSGQLV